MRAGRPRGTVVAAALAAATLGLASSRAQETPPAPEPVPAPAPMPAPADVAPPSSARVYLEGLLATEHLALSFRQTPLADVVRTVQDRAWINVVLDPAVDRGLLVTHQDEDQPLGPALDALLAPHDLSARIVCDVVWIGRRGAPAPAQRTDTIPAALAAFTINHALVPLGDVLRSLGDLARVRFELSPGAQARVAGSTVSLRVRNLPLHHLMTLLTAQVGLTWTRRDGAVWVHAPDEDPAKLVLPGAPPDLGTHVVTLSFQAQPLSEVLSVLHGLTGVELTLTAGIDPAMPVTVRVVSAALPAALDRIGDAAGLIWRRVGDGVVFDRAKRE